MINVVMHLVALTATVLLLARLLPSVRVKSVGSAIVVAIVFSVLNILLGWFIRALLFVPALLTFGLLFLCMSFIVNTVLLWLTDKLIGSFEIKTLGGLLTSSAVITAVNWLLFHYVSHGHRLVMHHGAGSIRWI